MSEHRAWATYIKSWSTSRRVKWLVPSSFDKRRTDTDIGQNRLLTMIRQQQAQIVSLQSNPPPTSAIIDEGTPTSERSLSLPQPQPQQPNTAQAPPSTVPPRPRSPLGPSTYGGLSRHSSFADRSRGSSHTGSPALRPVSRGVGPHESTEWLPGSAHGASRDEGVFYQAETQMLTRENQMLKLRIRELGRLIKTKPLQE
jgi:hypothetical protein